MKMYKKLQMSVILFTHAVPDLNQNVADFGMHFFSFLIREQSVIMDFS